MNLRDLGKPERCVELAFRGFVLILGILLLPALAALVPFGPLLVLGAASYFAWRIRQASPQRPRRERSTSGAERTPVLRGGGRQI